MGQVDDLSSLLAYTHYLTWDYGMGPLRCSLVRGLFRRQQCCGLIGGKWCCLCWCSCGICFCLRFPGQSRTMQEYVRVGVLGSAYIGFRPADGLSVELEGWTSAYRTPLGRTSLNKVYE